MLPTLSRRELLGGLIGTGLALTISRNGAADERAARKFTERPCAEGKKAQGFCRPIARLTEVRQNPQSSQHPSQQSHRKQHVGIRLLVAQER